MLTGGFWTEIEVTHNPTNAEEPYRWLLFFAGGEVWRFPR